MAIPSNKLWRVTLMMPDGTQRVWTGYAPNKLFARWNARDELGHTAFYQSTYVRVGLLRSHRTKLAEGWR